MSKIRIYGDTSGYIDVAAPATADNSTLSLDNIPKKDSANTFTSPLTINSDIDETSEYNAQLVVNSQTKAAGEYARILFQHDDHGSASITSDYESSGNGNLIFATRGGGNPTERMRISSAGHVTVPYQPAFNVTSTASFSVNDWAPYTDTYTNIGNHMNTSTGVFTVPISGTYVFFFGTIGTTNHADVDVYLKVNGVTTRGAVARPDDTGAWASMAAGTGILTLSANDTVNVWSSASNVYSDVNQWAHFRGYLIG